MCGKEYDTMECSGNYGKKHKAWLRRARRLHAAILRARLRAARVRREEIFGSVSDSEMTMISF